MRNIKYLYSQLSHVIFFHLSGPKFIDAVLGFPSSSLVVSCVVVQLVQFIHSYSLNLWYSIIHFENKSIETNPNAVFLYLWYDLKISSNRYRKKISRIEDARKYSHQVRTLDTNFSKTTHRISPRFCKVSSLIITNDLK